MLSTKPISKNANWCERISSGHGDQQKTAPAKALRVPFDHYFLGAYSDTTSLIIPKRSVTGSDVCFVFI